MFLSAVALFLWTLADGITGRTAQVGTAVPLGAWSVAVQSRSGQQSEASRAVPGSHPAAPGYSAVPQNVGASITSDPGRS